MKLTDLQAGGYTTIRDSSGADGWNAGNNDFPAMVGFSGGSTLSVLKDSTVNPSLTYYTIHDQATNADFTITIKSLRVLTSPPATTTPIDLKRARIATQVSRRAAISSTSL
uniref:Uncharacterized protein n=1 Tax=Caulobacter sp. (strain K31) TaxID=366602 RepID=B0T439_CAUSK